MLSLFSVNKIVEKTKSQPPGSPVLSASASLQLKQLQSSILNDSDIGITGNPIESIVMLFPYKPFFPLEINTIMQVLLDKKKLLEAEDQSIEMEVLLDFLNATKKRKMDVCTT